MTRQEAARALGSEPGPGFYGPADLPGKMQCRYGAEQGVRAVNYVAVGLDTFATAAAAKGEYQRQHDLFERVFVAGTLSDVAGIGDRAMMVGENITAVATVVFLKGTHVVKVILVIVGAPESPKAAGIALAKAAAARVR